MLEATPTPPLSGFVLEVCMHHIKDSKIFLVKSPNSRMLHTVGFPEGQDVGFSG